MREPRDDGWDDVYRQEETAARRWRKRELLAVLVADPGLVPLAAAEVSPKEIGHQGLRLILEGLSLDALAGLKPKKGDAR